MMALQPGILDKNRGMGRQNKAVAIPSRDQSPTDFRRPFGLQAALGLGVSHSEGKAAASTPSPSQLEHPGERRLP